jgi:AcrR family transcriptional regulator
VYSAGALFARNGIAATTVRQIADEVGILSASLYHHFESKEAIVDVIISTYLVDLLVRYEKVVGQASGAGARLHELIVASLEVVDAHPHATEIYQNDVNYLMQLERFSYLRNVGGRVQDAWLHVVRDGIAEGVFRSDLDPRIVYRLMRDAVWMSVRWFRPSSAYPVAKLAEDCASLLFNGLTTAREEATLAQSEQS